MVVGLLPERTPKPQNKNIDHATTMITRDQAMGLANCNDIISRVCSISPKLTLAAENASLCASVEGLSDLRESVIGRQRAKATSTLSCFGSTSPPRQKSA